AAGASMVSVRPCPADATAPLLPVLGFGTLPAERSRLRGRARRILGGPRLIASATAEVVRADGWGTLAAGTLQVIGAGAALAIVVAGKLTFDAILDPPHARLGLATALLLLAIMTALSGSM